jgi:amino acid transporter
MFKIIPVLTVDLIFIILLFRITRKKDLLISYSGGRQWLTWLSISLIAFIIESSSVFYAPAEVFQRIGYHSYFFILLAFLFYHYLTSRFVEISEIMETNNIKDGGVYAFVDFIAGPNLSFLIVASLLVTYMLTASISAVSAMENNNLLFQIDGLYKVLIPLILIWFITLVNILGIKLLPRIVFIIFLSFLFLLLNMVLLGIISMDKMEFLFENFSFSITNFVEKDIVTTFGFIFFGLSMMAIAFNGLESVLSNFRFVRNWKEIGKSYIFLFFIGFLIPILFWSLLPQNYIIARTSGNMIPFYFMKIGGKIFGSIIGILAAAVLIIVINYSFNSFNDLLEKVAKKFNFSWFLKSNYHKSYFRIHLISGVSCSLIIILANANQFYLSELLALAILSNLTIIMTCLMVYRYFRGTEQISLFNTSRFGTAIFFVVLIGCMMYLILDKIIVSGIWILFVSLLFIIGSKFVKKHPADLKARKKYDNPMELIFYLSEIKGDVCNVFFVRAKDKLILSKTNDSVFINFYYLNEDLLPKIAPNHFRFQVIGPRLFSNILAIIELIKYEIPNIKLKIHFGWPLSSWLDRISIGVMLFSIMKLPKDYPNDEFVIEYNTGQSIISMS